MDRTLTLSFSCPDASGIVAAVSSFVAQHKGWITEASQHTEHELARFFMRMEIKASSLDVPPEAFGQHFSPLAKQFGLEWTLSDSEQPRRVVLGRGPWCSSGHWSSSLKTLSASRSPPHTRRPSVDMLDKMEKTENCGGVATVSAAAAVCGAPSPDARTTVAALLAAAKVDVVGGVDTADSGSVCFRNASASLAPRSAIGMTRMRPRSSANLFSWSSDSGESETNTTCAV